MDIYELWYEWLKRTDENNWSERVRSAFTDCSAPFPEWWEDNEHLFERFEPITHVVLESAEDYRINVVPGEPREVVVLFFLSAPKAKLVAAFNKLLEENYEQNGGPPKYEDYVWEFPLDRRIDAPTLRTLEIMLKVWDERENGNLKLWQIGEKLKLNPSQITSDDDAPKIRSAKRAVMTATVSRYLRWAENVRTNVTQGIFPRYQMV